MSVSKIAGILLGSAAVVAGHGYVSGAVVDGTYYAGYDVTSAPYSSDPPDTIGWSTSATDLGFVDGSSYSDPDIICHKDAENGAISAEITAGGDVELQWTEWPESHHGPVITYLANCNGDCSTVDKTTLEFFKIEEKGLVDDSEVPGTWASDQLIASNNSWTVTIPSSIAAGNYVMRHEIIALHSSGNENGAQNYPQCLNLKVTGGGSDKPTGTLGTALYKNTDPGILVNIYQSLSSYDIPGPALYSGSSSGSGSSGSSTTAAPSSVTPSPSSSAIPSSSSVAVSSSAPGSSFTSAPAPTVVPTIVPTVAPTAAPTAAPPAETSTATAYETATAVESITVTAAPPQQTKVQVPTTTAPAAPVTTSSSGATVPTPGGDSGNSGNSGSSGSGISGSLSDYFDSLSAEQFLNLLRETLSWLITDKKHPRDIST
ncbi:hypothetical protein FE257_005102 [Aspergillus nanangensis]|uniref:Auxiliary Activity family 9 catalytic domain-containing protein n=1 Tax=Aspergillus nanangensis TaxID=2582783 RepID=A0AAD4CAF0_ASPNN|nr:hypothetical protein FE257_005102 [Aspergillus nanangensis]